MEDYQIKSKIHPKQKVKILYKENDSDAGSLKEGIVAEVLTETEEHYRGIKVRLTDGTVGRVREIIRVKSPKK